MRICEVSYHKNFFKFLLFDHKKPNDTKNRFTISWTTTQLAIWLLLQFYQSLWVFKILSCFSWQQHPLLENIWTTRHMLCLRLWCDDPRRPARAQTTQEQMRCRVTQHFKSLINEPATSWAFRSIIKTGTRIHRKSN